ncbi:MAG: sigma-54-dependent Fis family transcriptional regulator [Planctomycetota bacterium]
MRRILLVEDETSTQVLLRRRLEEFGHEVVAAPTGAMGLMEARAGQYDLFLVDIGLGSGIDGYEVCRRLKGIPATATIPVVLISGRVKGQEDLHRGYQAGCEAYLVKGDLTLLEDVVRAMLRIKTLQDDLALQNHLLEQQNRRLSEERQRGADLETALRETGGRSLVFRELAAGRPDAVLLVDTEGIVRFGDRGARAILGAELEGRHLATFAPDSGLEAFVRDARTDTHEAYRFDLRDHGGQVVHSLSATVVPLVPAVAEEGGPAKVVLILDAGKRRVAAELLRVEEQGTFRGELGPLLEAARGIFRPGALVGSSAELRALRERVETAAAKSTPVLLRGETGTGKRLVARVLHYTGHASGPFVAVNCAAMAPEELEAELFGYVKGVFPGAVCDRPGLLQQAAQGTVFLDEISEMPSSLQAKLLRVLEQGEVTRLGSSVPERAEARIIAATSLDLGPLAEAGAFRKDLIYRLGVSEILLPPLRGRMADIELLAEHFLRRFDGTRRAIRFSDEALWVMKQHEWPGNVRELRNCVESAIGLARGEEILVEDLPQPLGDLHRRLEAKEIPAALPKPLRLAAGTKVAGARPPAAVEPDAAFAEDEDAAPTLVLWEKRGIADALRRTGGDKLAAARLLGLGKSTFYRKLKIHGLA